MTRADALQLLSAGTSYERLKAARFLASNVKPEDLPLLKRARHAETVSYVKASLDLAIKRSLNQPTTSEPDPLDEQEIPDAVRRQIRSQAVDWVTGMLLHEIASPIGLVARSASREMPDYEHSRTKRHLDHLQRIFEGIEQLKGAAATPKPEQFNLAELLDEIIARETAGKFIDVSLVGSAPMLITSDPRLLHLAICNGIRNAIEAIETHRATDPHSIIVTWGQTDVDCWLAVIDKGAGVIGPMEPAFEIGKSTKQGHSGFGLAIARQAMETLGGTATLQPAAGGGARYELRWER